MNANKKDGDTHQRINELWQIFLRTYMWIKKNQILEKHIFFIFSIKLLFAGK